MAPVQLLATPNQLYGLVWPCGKLATIPILCFYLWAVVLSRHYGTIGWLHMKYSLKASSIPLIPFIIPSTSCSLFLSRAHCIEDNEDCTRLWDFFPAGQQLHQRGYHAAVHHHWQINASELVRANCRRTIHVSGCATARWFSFNWGLIRKVWEIKCMFIQNLRGY